MTNVQYTLFNFGVHDTREIGYTALFNEILDTQSWKGVDCLYWVDTEGLLHIVNFREKARLVFVIDNPQSFTCMCASMAHKP